MPPNHPNRNWRARMNAACADWLARWRWRDHGSRLIGDDELRTLLVDSYCTGYEAGRASIQRKAATTPHDIGSI